MGNTEDRYSEDHSYKKFYKGEHLRDHGYKPFPDDVPEKDCGCDGRGGVRKVRNTFGQYKFMHYDWIPYMRYWCYKVLPLAYDDSLSYYEVLCKCVCKLNEVIEVMDNFPEIVYEMLLHGYFLDNLMEQICPLNDHGNEITTADRHEGELIWLDGDLYMITRDMLAGERYVLEGTEGATPNIRKVTFEGFVRCLTDGIKKGIAVPNENWNHKFSAGYKVGQLIWWKDHLYWIDKDVAEGESIEDALANGKMHEYSIEEFVRMLNDKVKYAISFPNEKYGTVTSRAYNTDDLFWWNDNLYIALQPLAEGESISDALANGKIRLVSIDELIKRERSERIDADDKLNKRVDKEIEDRKAGDEALDRKIDKEIDDRKAGDDALGRRIDDEARARQDADNKLSNRINLEASARVDGDCNIQNQINNILHGSSKDTNTLTQLTYHEWRGTIFLGNTGRSWATAMSEVANKVQEIVNAGGHAELCRVQLYGAVAGTGEGGLGFNSSAFLSQDSGGTYSYSAAGASIIPGDFDIVSKTFSTNPAGCHQRDLYYSNTTKAWAYTNTDINRTTDDIGWEWQFRLVYQSADYIQLR